MDVYVAGTLMFPDERGKQDDRAVSIAKTHGVWVALASFAGADRWRFAVGRVVAPCANCEESDPTSDLARWAHFRVRRTRKICVLYSPFLFG